MRILTGEVLSEGIAIGSCFFIDIEKVQTYDITNEIEINLSRLKNAIEVSKKQILDLKKSLANDKVTITIQILDAHLEILFDPSLIEHLEKSVREKKPIFSIINDFIKDFEKKIKDPFFKQRIKDIEDVLNRIKSNLRSINSNLCKEISTPSILISNEIVPSDLFEINNKNIVGVISQKGSFFSHAAIIARSKSIPFLSNINIEKIQNIKQLILDCNTNNLILDPSDNDIKNYGKKIFKNRSLIQLNTKDKFDIFANINNEQECSYLKNYNIKGIGLLRSEFLFFKDKKIPSMKKQISIYKKIAKNLNGKMFVIRLFDFGLDKDFDKTINQSDERGIGYLLKNKEL